MSVRTDRAWIPIPLFLAAIAAMWAADLHAAWDSRRLLMVLNLVFLTGTSLFVAFLAGRSFLFRGTPGLLLLCCSVLLWGFSGSVAVAVALSGVVASPRFADIAVTVHNLCVLMSGVCHLGVALFSRYRPTATVRSTGVWLAGACTASAGAIALIAFEAMAGNLPPFFVEGAGGTPLRQAVLGTAVILFLGSGLLLHPLARLASRFESRYAAALLLIATGLFGVMLESAMGSPLSWTGRLAQYLGSVYLVIAAVAFARESREWGISLEARLALAKVRFDELFDLAADGIVFHELSSDRSRGTFIRANPAICAMLDYTTEAMLALGPLDITAPEELESVSRERERLLLGDVLRHEKSLVARNGRRIPVEIATRMFRQDGRPMVLSIIRDASERRRAEAERESTMAFLRLVNESRDVDELLRRAAAHFQQESGIEAVGIRLREGDDYPYAETRGFPAEFVDAERRLCEYDAGGNLLRDVSGNPRLACMCGTVLRGLTDPEKPFFTRDGSFWTNSTSELLAESTEADRGGHTRNRCNAEGYESVALIPLHTGGESLGLLQLNDRRKGMFDPAALSLWERRAGYLSIALGRLRAEESLLRSSRRSRLLADTASELLRTPAPQRVVESVCIRVMEKLRCDLFFNFLLDEKAGKLHLNAFAGIPPEEARRIEWLERGVAVCGCVARDGVPVVVSDVQNTPDERTGLVRSYGIRAYACHPLLGLGGSVAGTLSFGTRNRNGFNEEDLSLMRRVTDLVSIAISRVQGEEALAAAMRRIEAHVDNSLLAVVEFDREFRIIRWSEGCERLFGWRADEVVGQTMLSVPWVHEEDRDRVVAESVGLLDGTKPRSLNVNRNYRKDGSVIHCEWYSSALYDHEGRLESILSEVADITERRRMEAELARHRERLEETVRERTDDLRRAKERLEREIEVRKAMEEEVLKAKKLEAVGVLAAGIAHDFNNALTAISNSVAAARLSLPPDGAASERLQVAEDAARNAKSLTQQLLTFSKGGDPVRKTLSIGRLAHETARFAVRGSNVRCAYAIQDDLWFADVDGGQIGQVLGNIVINADQSMPKGGTIDVEAENVVIEAGEEQAPGPGRYVRISVSDRGCGIPAETLPRIFDPYFTTKPDGVGLGLYSSYAIVRKHGGHIAVEPRPGGGTVFRVYLPASDGMPVDEPVRGPSSRDCDARVLVLEDDPLVAESVVVGLGLYGMKVDRARDGEAAVAMYRRAMEANRRYDAVILDLTIPGGMGGEEAIRQLVAIDPDVRAVVASGYSEARIMSDFAEYGFRGVIPKPYELEDLVEMLRRLLAAP